MEIKRLLGRSHVFRNVCSVIEVLFYDFIFPLYHLCSISYLPGLIFHFHKHFLNINPRNNSNFHRIFFHFQNFAQIILINSLLDSYVISLFEVIRIVFLVTEKIPVGLRIENLYLTQININKVVEWLFYILLIVSFNEKFSWEFLFHSQCWDNCDFVLFILQMKSFVKDVVGQVFLPSNFHLNDIRLRFMLPRHHDIMLSMTLCLSIVIGVDLVALLAFELL